MGVCVGVWVCVRVCVCVCVCVSVLSSTVVEILLVFQVVSRPYNWIIQKRTGTFYRFVYTITSSPFLHCFMFLMTVTH